MYDLKTILLAKRFRRNLDITHLTVADIAMLEIIKNKTASNPVRNATITNGIATFDGVTVSKPLVSLKLNLPVTQTGSGTPSPDNIRDFVGVSGVTISKTGKNLINIEDKTILSPSYVIDNMPAFLPQKTYTMSFSYEGDSGQCSLRYDDENGNAIGLVNGRLSNGRISLTANLSANAHAIKLYSNVVGSFTDFQIELGSTATAYTPYNPNSQEVTISFGQTVYSAILDVLTGKLYLTHELKTIDENSDIDMTSIPSVFYLNDFFDFTNDTESVNCNCYDKDTNRANPNSVFNSNHDLTFCCRTSAPTLYIKDTRFTSVDNYKTWLSTNPVKIAVKLAEPIEIDITPTVINTLIGENVIFADVADVTECKYTRK